MNEPSLELTTVGQLLGTLDYMAPEQAERGGVVDYRADLYSLGATLFRLLVGRAPLAAAPNQSPLEKLRLLATESVPRLSSLRAEVPVELVQLVDELLRRHPEERPASAAHVAERLEQLAVGSDLTNLIGEAKKLEVRKPVVDPATLSLVQPSASNDPPRRTAIRRWLAWALLPIALAAGIFITIDTQKGRVVIESDVADIQVRIVKDGQSVDKVKIRQGNESTKLWAGKYEVVIDGATEDLIVENGSFTLKRGEIVIARITQRSGSGETEKGSVQQTPVDPAEPTYKDKTLAQWLAILRRERDARTVLDCFTAIQRLDLPENSDAITEAVLFSLRTFDESESIKEDGSFRNIDTEGFDVLQAANVGKSYPELLMRELKSADPSWFRRVLRRIGRTDENYDWSAVREWLLAQLQNAPTTKPGQEKVASIFFHLRSVSRSDVETRTRKQLIDALIASPAVTNETWLQLDPPSQHYTLSNEIREEVNRRALEVFKDSNTPTKATLEATMLLASVPEFSGKQKVAIARAIVAKLREAAASPNRLGLISVDNSYLPLSAPQVSPARISISGSGPQANLLGELLDLASAAGLQGKLDESLKNVMQSLGNLPPLDSEAMRVSIKWPRLAVSFQSRPQRRGAAVAGMAEPFPVEELMPRVLLSHPMFQDYRDRHEDKPAENTESSKPK